MEGVGIRIRNKKATEKDPESKPASDRKVFELCEKTTSSQKKNWNWKALHSI